VIGEAGSGTSRLVYGFMQRLLEHGGSVFEARGSPLTRAVPYAPIAQILRQLFAIEGEDDRDCACDNVSQKLGDSISGEDYAALCELVTSGEGDAVATHGQHALRSVVTLIDHMSEQTPVTVIVEDLHWIDESSLELLQASLSGERRRSAVMLVVTQRPDFQRAWHTNATRTSLQLLPLRDDDARKIIEARAGGPVPDALERRILDTADGNPFFLEEITRSLVEQETLVADDDGVQLTRPVSEIAIPGTVQELIGARLDRLQPAAKRTAQVASVLGRQFHHERLEELLAEEAIDVQAELDELERRGILHRNASGLRTDYRFGESLTQAVAYESLLLKERRQLHGRVAALIEERHGTANASERAGLIAHHLARSENRDKALVSLLQAATQAEELPSYPNAMELYREAWRLAEAELEEEDADDATLRALLAATSGVTRIAVVYSVFERGDVEQAAIRGAEIATELGDRRQLAHMLSMQGMFIVNSDPARFAQGRELIEEAIHVAEKDGTPADVTGIERALSWTCVLDGDFDRALAVIESGIERLREVGEAHARSDLYLSMLSFRASTLLWLDDLGAALSAAEEVARNASEVGNRTLHASAANQIARVRFLMGDYEEARRRAEEAIEIGQQIGGVSTMRSGSTLQVLAQLELGEKPREKTLLEQIDVSIGSLAEFARDGDLTVEALVRIGEQERAERYLASAMRRSGGRLALALDALADGHVAMGRGTAHWRDAARAYARAKELAMQLRAPSIEAAAQVCGAELAIRRDKPEVAELLLDKAEAAAREKGLVHYLRRAEQLRAEMAASDEPPRATVDA
jgi:tetratricopeptide (TPR) repeat protein